MNPRLESALIGAAIDIGVPLAIEAGRRALDAIVGLSDRLGTGAPVPDPRVEFRDQPDDVLLAMLVWGEARGEDGAGKFAVACVALNRAKLAPRYGADLRGVILRPWQFSCFNPKDPNIEKLRHPLDHGTAATWEQCHRAAVLAIAGAPDITGGATHYSVTGELLRTKWDDKLVRLCRIGSHDFFGMEI